jgi:cytochrome c551/c552
MKKWKVVVAMLIVAAVGTYAALGSMDHPHHPMAPLPTQLDPAVLAQAAQSYDQQVKPLFQHACFDCHSKNTVWPWYYAVPGVRQYIESHVEEGREDLDLTDGFPFNTDVPVLKHLRRIAGVVKRGDMPLWDYKLMHPAARLSDADRQVIVDWAQGSFDRLTSTAKDSPGGLTSTPSAGAGEHHHHHQD